MKMQTDGNLVMSTKTDGLVFHTGTFGASACPNTVYLVLRTDGVLVTYDQCGGGWLWHHNSGVGYYS